ncbi:Sec-independent protein translocase subunit TatA/TatB [Riemerella columbina]|uniref:Sec-independent protein translocase subunit TatA/TatB n=1 Tax=Riemerella columbina TaxID=103810 RepID=UPI00266F3DFC|nr:twin-arginine translocase TatA/TatE family subunit [Riemerella columbina]WKS95669.1 twin-arginine translocase TatA/TatE family subunit [Riemerella columbina]
MGDFSFSEMLMIALVIVVLFGPKKIPQIARELGQGVRKMKSAMEDIKTEIMKETDNPVSEIKKEIEQVKQSVQEVNPMNDIKNELTKATKDINVEGTGNTDAPKISPLEDETYEGPVSR